MRIAGVHAAWVHFPIAIPDRPGLGIAVREGVERARTVAA
jgi:hypothetical protein